MFRSKATIFFALIGIGTTIGFISGVAPGYFLKKYALFGIGIAFAFTVFLLLVITTLLYQHLSKYHASATSSNETHIFHESLSKTDKILLIFTSTIFFTSGIFLGILCEFLLRAIDTILAVHLIIASIIILILLIVLVIILILEMRKSEQSKIDHREQPSVFKIESNPTPQILTKPQNGPQNTAARVARYRVAHIEDDPSFPNARTYSTNTFNTSKPTSSMQREYQKLLNPPPRFYVNDKVYVNDNDIARILEADGLGNYRIQYLDNGQTDFKNGKELRKALPMVN